MSNKNSTRFTHEQILMMQNYDEWKHRLPDFGMKDHMRNFSKNDPLEVLRDFNCDRMATSVAAIGSEKLWDKANEIIKMYKEQKQIENYVKENNIDLKKLKDEGSLDTENDK